MQSKLFIFLKKISPVFFLYRADKSDTYSNLYIISFLKNFLKNV